MSLGRSERVRATVGACARFWVGVGTCARLCAVGKRGFYSVVKQLRQGFRAGCVDRRDRVKKWEVGGI